MYLFTHNRRLVELTRLLLLVMEIVYLRLIHPLCYNIDILRFCQLFARGFHCQLVHVEKKYTRKSLPDTMKFTMAMVVSVSLDDSVCELSRVFAHVLFLYHACASIFFK